MNTRHTWLKRAALAAIALAIAWSAYEALRARPIPVDTAVVSRGLLETTIDEEGMTRIRDIYRVSAPIAGHLERSALKAGDRVRQGSRVASIHPADPALLDVRTRSEADAGISVATAAIVAAQAEIQRVRAQLGFAQADLVRAEALARDATLSRRSLDESRLLVNSLLAQLAQAQAQLALRRSELDNARARARQTPANSTEHVGKGCCVPVLAPVDGVVLRVLTESEQVVNAGTPLVEIGNPANLEVIVDLLSADAVDLAPGARAWLEAWGGPATLRARLRRIDPSGFTKVSALGIEEQRVNAVLDIEEQRDQWRRLGNDFSVFVRIVAWRGDGVLQVPLSALFRRGAQWAVFVVGDGRARLTPVVIGHRNDEFAEVRGGLQAGDRVVLHPSDRIANGVRIELR